MPEHIANGNHSPFVALRQMARQAAQRDEEHCDLCGEPVGSAHRHLLDLSSRALLCVCRACTLLFDRAEAGAGARRRVPTRSLHLGEVAITDAEWDSLRVPVNMAFFCLNSTAGRMTAFYPGPMGPTESLLRLETWDDLAGRHPILRRMEADVEALLVYRARAGSQHFLVPIDTCYGLAGLIRTHWRGLTGGREVWQQIERFFADLQGRATPVGDGDARP